MTSISITDFASRVALSATVDPVGMPIMVAGPPGIGKSEGVKQACDLIRKGAEIEVNKRTIKLQAQPVDLIIMHLVTYDPTDVSGLPVTVQRDDGKTVAEFVPHGELLKLVDAENLTIVLLDDLGQANNAVQAAAMQLVLERALNGLKLSDKVHFVAATNRREDKAGVGGIIQPLINRFGVWETAFDLDSWSKHMLSTGAVPDEVVAFVRYHETSTKSECKLSDWKPSDKLENNPTPRGVERMGRQINAGLDSAIDIAAAVGDSMATSWLSFRKLISKIPNLDKLIKDPDKAPLPDNGGVQFALVQALFSLARKDDKLMAPISKYLVRFGKEGKTGTEQLLCCTFIRDLDTCENRDKLLAGATPILMEFGELMTRSMR